MSSRKREIRKLQLQRNRPVTAKKCTRKGDARCCCAFQSTSINCALFWRSRCFRPRDKLSYRAIFVWPWNENARTKHKQPTNANRAIWLVYGTDTNERGFWLVKRTIRWKNFMPENFLEINRFFALTSYCNTIGQSNNTLSILGFSLAGKRRVHVLIFSSIGW